MKRLFLNRYFGFTLLSMISIGILLGQGGVIAGPNGEGGCTTTPEKNVGVCLQKIGSSTWICVKPRNKYEELNCSK